MFAKVTHADGMTEKTADLYTENGDQKVALKRYKEALKTQRKMLAEQRNLLSETLGDSVSMAKNRALLKEQMAMMEQNLAHSQKELAKIQQEMSTINWDSLQADIHFSKQSVDSLINSKMIDLNYVKVDSMWAQNLDSIFGDAHELIMTMDYDSINKVMRDRLNKVKFDTIFTSGGKMSMSVDSVHFSPTSQFKKITRVDKVLDDATHYADDHNIIYGSNPIVFVNGKEFSYEDFLKLDSDEFQSMNVLKYKSAVSLYGEKGKNGAIIVTAAEPLVFMQHPRETDVITIDGPTSYEGNFQDPSISSEEVITNPTREKLEAYGKEIREMGYEFDIKRYKVRNGKLVKLKVDFAGGIRSIEMSDGIENLVFIYYNDGKKPSLGVKLH